MKDYAYFAPIINAAICVNSPNWVTDTPCAIYINRNTVIFAFAPFALALITTCGFYCHNRNRSLAAHAPVTTEKGQSRGRAASAHLPALPSAAGLLLCRWVGHTVFSPSSKHAFSAGEVSAALWQISTRSCYFQLMDSSHLRAITVRHEYCLLTGAVIITLFTLCSCFQDILYSFRSDKLLFVSDKSMAIDSFHIT